MSEHFVKVSGIEHLTDVSGGRKECWCLGACCNSPEGRCICPECSCEEENTVRYAHV